jgi:hypothetical protein
MILLLLFTQIEISAKLKGEYVNKPLTIGDPFEIVLIARYPEGTSISEPFADSLEPFLIVDQKNKLVQEKGYVVNTYTIKLVPFNTGELKLPAFNFLRRTGDTVDTLSSEEIQLKVASVMPENMKDINDIKKAVEYPNFIPLILVGVLVAVALLVYIAYRYIRQLKKNRAMTKPLPPPWAEALAALDNIPREDWLTKGFFKRYYYAISEILKRYLERRFDFNAAEQTTTEIAAHLKMLKVPQREEFTGFFTRADMVKYAKYVPPHIEMNSAVDSAKELVSKTRPGEVSEGEK